LWLRSPLLHPLFLSPFFLFGIALPSNVHLPPLLIELNSPFCRHNSWSSAGAMPPSSHPRRSNRGANAAAVRRPPPAIPRSVSPLAQTSARATDSNRVRRRRAANASSVAASARTAANTCDAPRADGRSGAHPVAGAVACRPPGGAEARRGRAAASGDRRAPPAVGAGSANVR